MEKLLERSLTSFFPDRLKEHSYIILLMPGAVEKMKNYSWFLLRQNLQKQHLYNFYEKGLASRVPGKNLNMK